MKKGLSFCFFLMILFSCEAQLPTYTGTDLGVSYTPAGTTFKLWAPAAEQIYLRLYSAGDAEMPIAQHELEKGENGVWSFFLRGDHNGRFYVYQVKTNGIWGNQVPDIYAKAVGINGKKGAIISLESTNPSGWDKDVSPPFKNSTDAVLYELHVRDATIATSLPPQKKGKFLGLATAGLKNSAGASVGLDHIRDLGVTHVHLLPFFDFSSIDEANPITYNWGYDPLNYNVPEGSYSSAPADPTARIRELKTLVQAFHSNGVRVVMDVVYNHTSTSETSYFHQLVPGYYHRQNATGGFSNASACGNETASDRPMMQKFMLESLKFWMTEYHLDGFRFDLMAIHDIETMNLIAKELRKLKPDVLLYGEGWTAGDSPLPESRRALKKAADRMDNVAVFSDDIRDGLKGSVFDHHDKGFVSGKTGMEESVKFGIVAAGKHPQIDYSKVNYSKIPYTNNPGQVINYAECHDNHTLWDRLLNSNPNASESDRIKMHLLANTIVFTSQGIPFLHAGAEFLRTKKGVENSYNQSDEINLMDWDRKSKYADVSKFYTQLIALRKSHPAFRMTTAEAITQNLVFQNVTHQNFIAYRLNGETAGDTWKDILVLLNANPEEKPFLLPKGRWKQVLSGQMVESKALKSIKKTAKVPAISAMILVKE